MSLTATPQAETSPPRRLLLPEATLGFAGRTIRFSSPDPTLRFAVVGPHVDFLLETGEPDMEVACTIGDPEPSDGPVIFESGGTWVLRALPDGGEEVLFRTATDAGLEPLIRVRLDVGLRRAEVVHAPLRGREREVPVGFPLDEYLAARLLARTGAVVLHACALERDGAALVFMGHSGAGKSTMAELGERSGARVLSDDRTILVPTAAGVDAWGTPWHGSYTRGLSARATVQGIFLLVQAGQESVLPMAAGRAYSEMLVRIVRPTVNRREIERALSAVEHAAVRLGAAELRFRPIPEAYELARRAASAPVTPEA